MFHMYKALRPVKIDSLFYLRSLLAFGWISGKKNKFLLSYFVDLALKIVFWLILVSQQKYLFAVMVIKMIYIRA